MALNVDSKVASELSAAVKAKVSTLADDKQSTFADEFQAKARRKGAMKLLAWFFPVQLFLLGQVRLGVMFWVTMVVGYGFEDANFGFALPSLLKIAGGIWWVVEIVIVSRRVREYNEKVAFTILHDMERLNEDSVGANQIQGENAANRNEKMMKCGTCRAEIAATAETCPKCGAANKKKPARGGCLQYGAAAVLFIIVIAWLVRDGMMGARHAESGAPVQVTKAGTATAAEAIPSDIKVGDTITTPKFEVTVLSVNKMRRIVANEFSESVAADGGTYIAIQWEYKNISKKPINMTWSKPSLGIIDPDGAQYSADVGATITYASIAQPTEKILSNLNPGIKIKDADVFEVAEANLAKPGWKITINADRDVIFPLSLE